MANNVVPIKKPVSYGQRLADIRDKLLKINQLMEELKKLAKEGADASRSK